jgi:hypothetical protein
MSSAVRAYEQQPATHPLPIDGAQINIESAIKEIAAMESGRINLYGVPQPVLGELAPMLEQRQRLRDAKDDLIRAQALVYEYVKGPSR